MRKAYDKLSHEFLLQVLEMMGFPPYIIWAVKLILTGCKSAVMVNGCLSFPFELLSGVPQGSPLSPLLFILATEALRLPLEFGPVLGLYIAGIDMRVNLFADDLNTFVGSQASFNQFQHWLHLWCVRPIDRSTTVCESLERTSGLSYIWRQLDRNLRGR